MKVCSRCRSENFGDLKFCNYCGSRLRSPIPLDVYGGNPPLFSATQAVPAPLQAMDPKLAYRYFLKGKHAFAAGDLPRAAEMFRRALDAHPSDPAIKAFLRRVTECQNRVAATPKVPPPSRPSPGLTDVARRAPAPIPSPPPKAIEPAPVVAPPPPLKVVPKVAVSPPAPEPPPRLVALPQRQASTRTGATMLRAGRPTSPATHLSAASGLEPWTEALAAGLIVLGLVLFGWMLLSS